MASPVAGMAADELALCPSILATPVGKEVQKEFTSGVYKTLAAAVECRYLSRLLLNLNMQVVQSRRETLAQASIFRPRLTSSYSHSIPRVQDV